MTAKNRNGELRQAAEAIARGAGTILRDAFHQKAGRIDHKSTLIDLVTDTDHASEQYVLSQIASRFPDHAVLAEESGGTRADGPMRWVIDPLDGTVNFAHRIPMFCVLIAVQERQSDGSFETVAGVTYDPLRDEMFSAHAGGGATLNEVPMRVSSTSRLIDAVVTTGFAYGRLFREDDNHREFCRLNLLTQGARRIGSAGMDLAYVACGRFDGSWEYELNAWDVAGGILMTREAGGRVTSVDGGAVDIGAGNLVATNGHLHDAMIAALASSKSLEIGSREGLAEHLPSEVAARLPVR